ncbi:unnamed protein product [Notodromas monacha]|uniref:Histone deacetylase interacting domain-containing protein n=1 Tax=Notodromas monacha TaxID=399045 RepID=A0A7R9BIL6_9CRUS|nr:unnamed protein product [Notodromas monacha]CAG0915392.1 unnamed protein product [Notodromas monacha]
MVPSFIEVSYVLPTQEFVDKPLRALWNWLHFREPAENETLLRIVKVRSEAAMKRQPVATVVAATSTSSSTSAPLNPATSVTATGAGPPTTIVVAPTLGASCSPLPTKTRPVTVRPRFSAPIPQVSHFAQRAAVNQVPAAFTVSPRAVVDVAFQNKDGPIVRPVLRRVEGSAGQNTPVFVSVAGTVVAGKVSPAVQFPTGGFPTRPPSNSLVLTDQLNDVSTEVTYDTGYGACTPGKLGDDSRPTVSVTPSTQLVPSIPNQQVQRLKVEDALSYLDKVKYKFSNDPGVYNNFLDIMKEFKSQTLSTPGVIKRVSSLFEDHPELIVGFNTFLPPGYKIEIATIETVSFLNRFSAGFLPMKRIACMWGLPYVLESVRYLAPRDPPSAASVMMTPSSPHLARQAYFSTSLVTPVSVADANTMLTLKSSLPMTDPMTKQSPPITHTLVTTVASSPVSVSVSTGAVMTACSASVTLSSPSVHSATVVVVSSSSNNSSAVPAVLPVLTSSSTQSNEIGTANSVPQVEFDHAISYVNKIKVLRFNNRPEIYKQFLEILHSYQKDQKETRNACQGPAGLLSFPSRGMNAASKLSEAEVYAKVKKLFENQDDLLHEFSQFLPEATGINSSLTTKMLNDHGSLNKLGGSSMIQTVHSMATSIPPPGLLTTSVASINQDSSKLPPLSNMPRAKPSFSQNSVVLIQSSHQGFLNHQSGASVQRKPVEQVLSSPMIGTKRAAPTVTNGGQSVSLNGQPPAKKVRMSAGRPGHLAATAKFSSFREFSFFNQVKKTLGDSTKYQIFLRLVALYNFEVVSKVDLLGSFQELLGDNPELLKFVKNFVKHPKNWPSVACAEGTKKHSTRDKTPIRHSVEDAPSVELEAGIKSADEPAVAKVTPKIEGPGIWMNGRSTRYSERDLDFSNARRLGASYCEVPKERQRAENFSNYTPLCREVLNHEWVSFPSWSEDSTFVSMRKTQYEEYIYRCEDERYELDMLIETNKRAIDHFERILENVHKMSPEERSGYCLDPSLGDRIPALLRKAIERYPIH